MENVHGRGVPREACQRLHIYFSEGVKWRYSIYLSSETTHRRFDSEFVFVLLCSAIPSQNGFCRARIMNHALQLVEARPSSRHCGRGVRRKSETNSRRSVASCNLDESPAVDDIYTSAESFIYCFSRLFLSRNGLILFLNTILIIDCFNRIASRRICATHRSTGPRYL